MTSLRDDVRELLETRLSGPQLRDPDMKLAHKRDIAPTADAIIQAITTRLTSEEAVRAAMSAMDDHAFSSQNVAALAAIQAAIGRATHDQ